MGHNYFVYITTNASRKVFYTGVTNDLRQRLYEHKQDALGDKKSFAGKYNCHHLLYWERHSNVHHAIAREKEIKGWVRAKKKALIESLNPSYRFLEEEVD
jgi:putative endonuclease